MAEPKNTGNLNIPPRRGRPPGARSKKGIIKTYEKVYTKIENMLTDEQRAYYTRAFQGKEEFDPVKHGELFMLLFTLYTTDVLNEAIEGRVVSQDIAQTVAQYRMGLKDMDEMLRNRDKQRRENEKDERLVDPTRKPKVGVLAGILEGTPQG